MGFSVGTGSGGRGMGGKSPVTATEAQRLGLAALAGSRDRGEADRARAVLLTPAGWTSRRIAAAFGVREDTVRLWRSDFGKGGVDALKARIAPGPLPVKSSVALRVATPLLEEPVANRPNWTIPRLRAEIEGREGVRISRSQAVRGVAKKVPLAAAPAHAEGTPDGQRGGSDRLAPQIRKRQAEAGDIVLLYGDESEASTHPYLARAWAKSGADLRVPAPGQAKKVAMLGSLDHITRQAHRPYGVSILSIFVIQLALAAPSRRRNSSFVGCQTPYRQARLRRASMALIIR